MEDSRFSDRHRHVEHCRSDAIGRRTVFQRWLDRPGLPSLKALLHIMRDGTWEGRNSDDPAFRALFSRDTLLASDWYAARLEAQRKIEGHLWERHARYLEKFLQRTNYADVAAELDIRGRLERVTRNVRATREPGYTKTLVGTLGAEPFIASELDRLSLH